MLLVAAQYTVLLINTVRNYSNKGKTGKNLKATQVTVIADKMF